MDLTGWRPSDVRTCPECGSDLLDEDLCEICLADLGEYPGWAAASTAAAIDGGSRE